MDPGSRIPGSSVCLSCGESSAEDADRCSSCGEPLLLKDRYRIVRQVGQQGPVGFYEVFDESAGKRWLLQLLDERKTKEYSETDRFQAQGRLLRRLDHPSIPRVQDDFQTSIGGTWYRGFLLDWVEGKTLSQEIERGRHLDEVGARRFLAALLKPLGYLHDLFPPVIHGNINPSSVLIPRTGPPLLTDFDTTLDTLVHLPTHDESAPESRGYLPEEQLQGKAVAASDLYGLGMTLVAGLAGRDVADLPLSDDRVNLDEAIQVSRPFQQVLARLVEPRVERRFQSVAEVRRALDALDQETSATPAPVEPVRTAPPPPPRSEVDRQVGAPVSVAPSARPQARVSAPRITLGRAPVRRATAAVVEAEVDITPLKRRGCAVQAAVTTSLVFLLLIGGSVLFFVMQLRSTPSDSLDTSEILGGTTVSAWFPTEDVLRAFPARWASTVDDFSSQYGGDSWSANQILGLPDVYPRHGDEIHAWAPTDPNGGLEWITVNFSGSAPTSGVVVVETYNPDALVRIDDMTVYDRPVTLWQNQQPPKMVSGSRVIRVDLPQPRPISRLRLVLDTTRTPGWNEIDAVGLILQAGQAVPR